MQLRDRKLRGRLEGADAFTNVYLEDVEEIRDENPNSPSRKFPSLSAGFARQLRE